jgi:predicted nucleotidyltransferase
MNIEDLNEIVHKWASGLDFRIKVYLFGSRLKGTHRADSDLDLAIEFLDSWHNTTLLWFDFHEQWQNELSELTGLKVDLQLYDFENENIRAYIKEKSVLIFEEPENDDLSSLEAPALLLNIESSDDESG